MHNNISKNVMTHWRRYNLSNGCVLQRKHLLAELVSTIYIIRWKYVKGFVFWNATHVIHQCYMFINVNGAHRLTYPHSDRFSIIDRFSIYSIIHILYINNIIIHGYMEQRIVNCIITVLYIL